MVRALVDDRPPFSMAALLGGLNDAQRAAVAHGGGPLLVLAGAGSGKTRVVTTRIARLIAEGVSGRSILAVTFTNKAAREMRERLFALVGRDRARGITVCTFHALAARMLRRDGHRIELSTQFTILDESDQLSQLLRVAKEQGVDMGDHKPALVLSRIGWMKNQGMRDEVPVSSSDPLHLLAHRLYAPYRRHNRALHAVDFDDLLLLTVELLERAPDVKKRYQTVLQHVLIDEYQDTNPVQDELVRRLVGPHRNLVVVGDDDQAIYGFRGSAIENILRFDLDWAPCAVVKLEENYRSTGHILACANAVIAKAGARKEKTLRAQLALGEKVRVLTCDDGEHEASSVASEIARAVETGEARPGDVALLYRANPQSRAFEEELRLRGVPYRVVGGQEFFERRDVKNVLAYLSLVARPSDELAFRRVVNLPARGLGEKTVAAVVEHARATNASLVDACVDEAIGARVKLEAAQRLAAFARPLSLARAVLARKSDDDDPIETLSEAVRAAGYQAVIDAEKDLAARERTSEALDEVLDAVASWLDRVREAKEAPDLESSWVVDADAPFLESFLDRVALDEEERRREREKKKDGDKSEKSDRVTLMSLHASKGLEFPVVYLVGLEEGLLPHRRVLDEGNGVDEERRLVYVGITRARTRLTITHARARRRRQSVLPRTPSRFLGDLPEESVVREGVVTGSNEELAAQFFTKMLSK